jgi:hypothetical protein
MDKPDKVLTVEDGIILNKWATSGEIEVIKKEPLADERFVKAIEALKLGKIDKQKDLLDKFELTIVQVGQLNAI